ncbi:putative small subunit of serine palmitoyltransferase [Helianthus annuus]|nr:putative small subunit of serine palmitoyltransferase [Helianthus annuus]
MLKTINQISIANSQFPVVHRSIRNLQPLNFRCPLKKKIHHYRFDIMSMNWVQRKIYLYNVTFGLYMLDAWERYLFNALVLVLMWFIFYNGYRNLNELCKRYIW